MSPARVGWSAQLGDRSGSYSASSRPPAPRSPGRRRSVADWHRRCASGVGRASWFATARLQAHWVLFLGFVPPNGQRSPAPLTIVAAAVWCNACWAARHTGMVSRATLSESDCGIEKFSFSKPKTRPVASFMRTTSSPVSSQMYSRERSVNQTVSVLPSRS